MSSKRSVKVLLDTDIGTDIDDAVCLAYLLQQPQCELLGVTTVTGEADKRAWLASAVCKAANVEVPFYPGCDRPMLIEQQQKLAQQAAALGEWPHERAFPKGEAIEFMRRTVRQHPGEVTLLTIGPLTNVGLLFQADPEIPSLLQGLVMMCGLFGQPVSGYGPVEWNAKGDPHATAMVYRAGVKQHRSVGLDVTHRVFMSADEFRRAFREVAVFQPVLDFAEVWFREYPGTTFHDPLAAATIFEPNLCQFEHGNVEIELQQKGALGKTRWTASASGRHQVASAVQVDRFFEHFLSVVKD